jgi:nucleotidyltransferase/DNA polymerase involved in DNA repair
MPRVISVFLPTLSTDRVRRKAGDTAPPPETPLILVGRDGRRRVVLAADAAAQSAGLRVGMPATKAQALVQGLVIRDANPAADAEALERLALWMLQRFAPIVAADPPDGIVIDSTGADHLHGGEAATLATLVEKLATVGLGARRLDLICQRVDSRAQAVRVGTGLPLRDVKRMARLLCDKIETIDPGFGIEVMTLAATVTEPLLPKQASSGLINPPEPDVSGLIDLLANRVGERNLYRAAPVASDVPERTVRHIPALSPETGAEWPGRWPRPSRLLTHPEAIDTLALLPDHPPASFTWRGVRRRVKRADGPERVFGEWWKRDPELTAVRDYFRLEDDIGERYWVYRAGDGEDPLTGSQRWFLHGVFG